MLASTLIYFCQSGFLSKDGKGDFFVDDGDNKLYWISFLDGMQRILLFTDDISVCVILEKVGDVPRIQCSIIVTGSMFGILLLLISAFLSSRVQIILNSI